MSEDSCQQFDTLPKRVREAVSSGAFQIKTSALVTALRQNNVDTVLQQIRVAQRTTIAKMYVEAGLSPQDAVWLATKQAP